MKKKTPAGKPIAISLFSGAMGLDIGLEKVGFDVRLCNEIEPMMAETIQKNRPGLPVICRDIREVKGEEIRNLANIPKGVGIDLLAGGPPCQAFSVYGKRKGIRDPRGAVIYEYVRMVKELQPKTFLMENVRGLLSMKLTPDDKPGSLLQDLQKEFGELGYRTETYVVNAVNYGAPQIRERIIVVGNRFGKKSAFPSRTHSDISQESLKPFATLRDALQGLAEKDPVLMDFSPRKRKYLEMIPEGENWRSLPVDVQKESMGKAWYLKGGRSAYWRRLAWDFPSPTVTTLPNHAGTSMCHPKETRPLTLRECARVQGFPDNWEFAGKTSDQYKQVGNAVPTKLGEVAGRAVLSLLKEIEKDTTDLGVQHTVVHIRPHVRTRQYFKNGAKTGAVSYQGGAATFYKEERLGEKETVSNGQLTLIPA
jgi:DNA (cytosine-5)-methyltransferase 1